MKSIENPLEAGPSYHVSIAKLKSDRSFLTDENCCFFLWKAVINLRPYQYRTSVFESPFKKIRINSEEYLRNLVIYFHQNPENFQNYKFSSYLAVFSETMTLLRPNKVMDWFGDSENFIACYQKEFNGNFIRDFEL